MKTCLLDFFDCLQDYKRINFCCFKPLNVKFIYGSPRETDRIIKVWGFYVVISDIVFGLDTHASVLKLENYGSVKHLKAMSKISKRSIGGYLGSVWEWIG